MKAAVQLCFEGTEQVLDPRDLAQTSILGRRALYADLGLNALERQALEEAVRLIIARRYRRAA
jgi:hypothetical protein